VRLNFQSALSHLRQREVLERICLGLALCVVPAMLGETNLPTQSHFAQAAKVPKQQGTVVQESHRRAARAYAASPQSPAPEPIVTQTSAAPAPTWPAIQPPSRAKVQWDSRGLEIEASNSSLNAILRQVAADTGAKLEGLTQDQRIFGSYGPGPASDVLLKLLDGSGYNVVMIGGRDADPPLQIILSTRSSASSQTAVSNQNRSNSTDEVASEEPEPEPQPDNSTDPAHPEQVQNPFRNGNDGLPQEPEKFMQEILDRQHKIDQQQQQDQQNNPPQ